MPRLARLGPWVSINTPIWDGMTTSSWKGQVLGYNHLTSAKEKRFCQDARAEFEQEGV